MQQEGVAAVRKQAKRRWIPLSLKFAITARPCVICGIDVKMCVDHIIPLNHGGADDPSNLQPLCQWCNLKKGGRLVSNDELMRWYLADKEKIDKHRSRKKRCLYCNPYDCPHDWS